MTLYALIVLECSPGSVYPSIFPLTNFIAKANVYFKALCYEAFPELLSLNVPLIYCIVEAVNVPKNVLNPKLFAFVKCAPILNPLY